MSSFTQKKCSREWRQIPKYQAQLETIGEDDVMPSKRSWRSSDGAEKVPESAIHSSMAAVSWQEVEEGMITDPEYRRRKRLAGGADLVEDDFRSMMRMNHSVCPSHVRDPDWHLEHNAQLRAGKIIEHEKRLLGRG